jgi:hypothetical protein
MPRPSSDRRAIKDRARSAPAPRAITSIGWAFARRDPAKSGLVFWRCLHRCAAMPVAAIGIVAMAVSGALGAS